MGRQLFTVTGQHFNDEELSAVVASGESHNIYKQALMAPGQSYQVPAPACPANVKVCVCVCVCLGAGGGGGCLSRLGSRVGSYMSQGGHSMQSHRGRAGSV